MKINDVLKKCIENPCVSLKEGPHSTRLVLNQPDGRGLITFFPLFPGISLAYIFINSPTWPAPELFPESPEGKGPLVINYCILGRCELLLNNGNYVYLKNGDFSLSENYAKQQYVYPGGVYEGLELFLDTSQAMKEAAFLPDIFRMNLTELSNLYCPNDTTYICPSLPSETRNTLSQLWDLYDAPEGSALFAMQLLTLKLLHDLLTAEKPPKSKLCEFFTPSQVEIAKKTMQIITEDLRQQHPAREMANAFSISETSLKNYFRGVYGQNISDYLRELRMNTAAELLVQTRLPVSQIAENVGYLNQSKFAAVFRRQFHMAPLEYRRRNRLDKQ